MKRRRMIRVRVRKIGKLKLLILFVAVIAVAMAASFTYISTPAGCRTCHEMRSFYDSWASSAHQEVDCHECHKADLSFYVNDMIKHIQGINVAEIEAEPPTSSSNLQCFSCHKDPLPSQHIDSSDISCFSCHEVDHYQHLPEIPGDYDCSVCHGDHSMTVKEETCASCHD